MLWALAGALLIGLSLGLMGSGGSILTVPVLTYLVGQDEKVAIAGSLAIVGTISLVASLPYARARRIDYRSVSFFGLPGMAGAYLGAHLSKFVAGNVQLAVFATLMLLAGFLMLRPVQEEAASDRAPRNALAIAFEGLLVGAVTGFVGVGGGFLIVPALVLLGGLGMHRAVGTSLLIIALKSYSGFYKYLDVLDELGLTLDWQILGTFSALGLAGSFAGNAVGSRLPQETLRRSFACFLFVIGGLIVFQSWPELVGASRKDVAGATGRLDPTDVGADPIGGPHGSDSIERLARRGTTIQYAATMKTIGIAAHSAEGGALCFLTACREGARSLGEHLHPPIVLSALPMGWSMPGWESGDHAAVAAHLGRGVEQLAAAGADFFVCPDNTAHIVLEEFADRLALPGLHIAQVVVDEIVANGWSRVGLLGTEWTMTGPVYERALAERGRTRLVPDETTRTALHAAIFDELCQGVFRPETTQRFLRAIDDLRERGAECVVLGCTEIPLVVTPENASLPVLDSTRLLARDAVRLALSDEPLEGDVWLRSPVART